MIYNMAESCCWCSCFCPQLCLCVWIPQNVCMYVWERIVASRHFPHFPKVRLYSMQEFLCEPLSLSLSARSGSLFPGGRYRPRWMLHPPTLTSIGHLPNWVANYFTKSRPLDNAYIFTSFWQNHTIGGVQEAVPQGGFYCLSTLNSLFAAVDGNLPQ